MIDNMAFITSLSQLISSGITTYKRGTPDPSPYILSTSPPDNTMELYVLKHKLQVCSIPKSCIKDFTHAIIKIALLSESRPNFFSITETFDGYTIIVTEEDFKELPKHDKLEITGQKWHVLTVSVGAMGSCNELVGVSKIARSVIGPLADQEISVLCMSTYQSDFILVEDIQLQETLRCLGSYFKIFNEDHQRVNHKQVLSSSPQSPIAKNIRPLKHPFTSPDSQYHITGLDSSKLASVMQVLMELLFYTDVPEDASKTFFHFSVVSGEISLVLDDKAMKKFPANSLYTRKNDDVWRMIRIGDLPLGFEECGIVAQVVEPLATAQLSTYYVSAFNMEYCMVLEKDIDRVLTLFEQLKIENIKTEKVDEELRADSTDGDVLLQDLDEKELRPGENISLATQINDDIYEFNLLSTSPQSPMTDDSSYGTSPPTNGIIDATQYHQSNNNLSNPIPIPPSEPNSVLQSFSKLKC